MAGLTVDGMVSGLSTGALVDSLIRAEGAQQTLLTQRLSATEKSAAAYRSINTKFDALRTAAEEALKPEAWNPVKATSSATSVSVAVTGTAQPGSLSFEVKATASAHAVISATTWSSTSDPSGYGSSLEVFNADNSLRGTITIEGTGSLAETVAAINKSDLGLTAAAVQVAPGQYRLQVTSAESGAAQEFTLGADPSEFAVVTQAADAHLKVGTGPGAYDVYSASNTFADLLPGVSITVTKPEANATINTVADPEKVADTMKALVDAANAALAEIKKHTATANATTSGASTANAGVLAGDFPLARLASQVLSTVTGIVGTHGTANLAGVELTRDGTVKFDKEKFLKALAEDPAKVQTVMTGTPAGTDPDGDGPLAAPAAVPGFAQRLLDLSKSATDKTTGTLTLLAKGRDDLADDIKDRIEAWDVRLDKRRENLMRQFTAMEVALSSLKSQSSWISSQVSALPTYE